MLRREFMWLAVGCGACAMSGSALAAPPETWDGLNRVKSKRLNVVYIQPNADFRGYRKVMIDPTEVAFKKNWARDYNRDVRGASGRISDADVEKATQKGAASATNIFADAFTKAGYPVVTDAGPDVLRVRTMLANIDVAAPDVPQPGRTTSFAGEAGEATLIIEVRDSETGALLGRGIDRKLAGDSTYVRRNSVTNRADFAHLVRTWADASARGLTELKALSPGPAAERK